MADNKIDASNYRLPSVREMVKRTNADSDHARFFWLGDNVDDCDGAIVVIKGNQAARLAAIALAKAGLYNGQGGRNG